MSGADHISERSPLTEILDVVMRLAAGDFSARATVSGGEGEIDALAAGVSMLGEEIEAKFAENQHLVDRLEQSIQDLEAKRKLVMSLSTPPLAVWDDILVLPLIGTLDGARADQLTTQLLEQTQRQAAKVVIVDVTGVPVIDMAVAGRLSQAFAAVSLMGARCVLTGLSPGNAQSMVELGVTVGDVATRGSLKDGLRHALALTRRGVARRQEEAGS